MKISRIFLGFVLLTVALMAGCAGKSAEVTVTADQNNNTIEIKKGDVLAVKLAANPSTGYGWEAENLDAAILEMVGEVEYQQEKTDQSVVGAPETAIIRIKAIGSGETAVKLIYHRSWEKGVDPLETFFLNVVVK